MKNNISEDIQWQIFEWLEGNLSDRDVEILQQKIEQSTELQQFVYHFKQTYLPLDASEEYPHKQQLLKAAPLRWTRNWSQYAAAAAVVMILGLGYLKFSAQPKNIVAPNAVSAVNSTISPKSDIQSKDESLKLESMVQSIKIEPKALKKPMVFVAATSHSELPTESKLAHLYTSITKSSLLKIHPEAADFFHNLMENQYLTSAQKEKTFQKWLVIYQNRDRKFHAHSVVNSEQSETMANVTFKAKPISLEEEQQNLSKSFNKEVVAMLKQGKLPKIKLVLDRTDESEASALNLQFCAQNTLYTTPLIN